LRHSVLLTTTSIRGLRDTGARMPPEMRFGATGQ